MTDATEEPQAPDEARRRAILDMLLSEAAFDGFTEPVLERSARAAGLEPSEIAAGEVRRLFPRGISDALAFWSEEEDRQMREAFEAENPLPHGVTKKIRWLVKQRIVQLDWNREAARRAAASLALPHHGALGAKLLWNTADSMWRAVGDTSTDFNHYSKRATLSALYASVLAHWFSDEGDAGAADPYERTWQFLDERLANLMQFEKTKAKVQKALPDPAALAGFLGKLRYRDPMRRTPR
ncbi:MAG: COQ9 family protein [Parvularcula sp.]|jgi:ubiquinone biosynthesis protein COQ9|nr:COQ9 family protein [Parvularcula sp.]